MIGLAAYYQVKYSKNIVNYNDISEMDRIPNLRLDA